MAASRVKVAIYPAVYSSFSIHFVLGCHVSVLLKEEWEKVDSKNVVQLMQKWQGVAVSLEVQQCYIYRHTDCKTIFALNVHSEDILNVRENLGFARKPKKYNMHISLLEKLE